MVVAVVWAKADCFREWLRALSCVCQHESTTVRVEPEGFGFGNETRRDRETKDRDMGSILVDYHTEELETSVQLRILRAERENVLGQIIIRDRIYGEEQSM